MEKQTPKKKQPLGKHATLRVPYMVIDKYGKEWLVAPAKYYRLIAAKGSAMAYMISTTVPDQMKVIGKGPGFERAVWRVSKHFIPCQTTEAFSEEYARVLKENRRLRQDLIKMAGSEGLKPSGLPTTNKRR
jgi:hypothetical protein